MKPISISEFLYQCLAPQSADIYLYTINHFLKTYPKAKRYKYHDLVNFLADTRAQYPKIQTSIRILSAIKKYYEYLVWTAQRNDHPCQTLTVMKGSDQSIQLQDLFSSQELELLLQRENRYRHPENRKKVLISLLIYQG